MLRLHLVVPFTSQRARIPTQRSSRSSDHSISLSALYDQFWLTETREPVNHVGNFLSAVNDSSVPSGRSSVVCGRHNYEFEWRHSRREKKERKTAWKERRKKEIKKGRQKERKKDSMKGSKKERKKDSMNGRKKERRKELKKGIEKGRQIERNI